MIDLSVDRELIAVPCGAAEDCPQKGQDFAHCGWVHHIPGVITYAVNGTPVSEGAFQQALYGFLVLRVFMSAWHSATS